MPPSLNPRLYKCAAPLLFPLILAAILDGQEIPLDKFQSSIYSRETEGQRSYPRYDPDQSKEIADNILLYQRSSGGWSEGFDPLMILDETQKEEVREQKSMVDARLDNRTTYPEIEYLSHAYLLHGDKKYRDGARKGLQFILDSQLPNGGFTHRANNVSSSAHIAFANALMPGTLSTLRKVAANETPFIWISPELKAKAITAVEKGTNLILQLQIQQNGESSIWARCYDAQTLFPTQDSPSTPPSLACRESVSVVEFLMKIDYPTPEIIHAVESAVNWFSESELSDTYLKDQTAERVPSIDPLLEVEPETVEDDDSPPVWAKYYDIETNAPLANGEPVKDVTSFEDIQQRQPEAEENYGQWPAKLLEKRYPAWKKRITQQNSQATTSGI